MADEAQQDTVLQNQSFVEGSISDSDDNDDQLGPPSLLPNYLHPRRIINRMYTLVGRGTQARQHSSRTRRRTRQQQRSVLRQEVAPIQESDVGENVSMKTEGSKIDSGETLSDQPPIGLLHRRLQNNNNNNADRANGQAEHQNDESEVTSPLQQTNQATSGTRTPDTQPDVPIQNGNRNTEAASPPPHPFSELQPLEQRGEHQPSAPPLIQTTQSLPTVGTPPTPGNMFGRQTTLCPSPPPGMANTMSDPPRWPTLQQSPVRRFAAGRNLGMDFLLNNGRGRRRRSGGPSVAGAGRRAVLGQMMSGQRGFRGGGGGRSAEGRAFNRVWAAAVRERMERTEANAGPMFGTREGTGQRLLERRPSAPSPVQFDFGMGLNGRRPSPELARPNPLRDPSPPPGTASQAPPLLTPHRPAAMPLNIQVDASTLISRGPNTELVQQNIDPPATHVHLLQQAAPNRDLPIRWGRDEDKDNDESESNAGESMPVSDDHGGCENPQDGQEADSGPPPVLTPVGGISRRLRDLELENGHLRTEKQRLEQMYECEVLCQICFERRRNAVILPCSHFIYCEQCLEKHWTAKQERRCPTCRQSVNCVLKIQIGT